MDNPFKPNSANASDFTVGITTTRLNFSNSRDATISVPIIADSTVEQNETFRFLLTTSAVDSSANSVITKNLEAIGTILNDDLGEISEATGTIGDRQITFSWTNPDSNIFAGVTISQTISNTATANCSSGVTTDAMKNTSITIALSNNTNYSFRICARSNTGSLSGGVALTNFMNSGVDDNGNGILSVVNAPVEAAEDIGSINFTIRSNATFDNILTATYEATLDNPFKPNSANASDFTTVGTASLNFSNSRDCNYFCSNYGRFYCRVKRNLSLSIDKCG